MPERRLEFGILGLGRMGANLAHHALEKGCLVVGFDPKGATDALGKAGLIEATSPAGFRSKLARPRPVFIYVPAGPIVDRVLDELTPAMEPGDIVVDGGNSYWGDSIRRHARLRDDGIRFVDLGTSGGIAGARRGACFMAEASAMHSSASSQS